MARVGIILLCRYDSKRLPGKILKKIKGKTVLEYILERLKLVELSDNIIVATSKEKNDDVIVQFCEKSKVNVFRGDKDNVAKRMLDCAKTFGLDYFVRVSGDNLLIDYALIDKLIQKAVKDKLNLVSNLPKRTFPSGISIEVLKTTVYERIYPKMKDAYDREHATTYLYENLRELGRYEFIYNIHLAKAKDLKLSLDTQQDFDYLSKLISAMKKDHTKYLLEDVYCLSESL
jgi:spore coat polysaccharide biosynthesis protein SpsF